MALVEAASRRLDFEQSRDDFSTGSKQPANVPTDFLTGSGNLMFLNIQTTSEGNSFFVFLAKLFSVELFFLEIMKFFKHLRKLSFEY